LRVAAQGQALGGDRERLARRRDLGPARADPGPDALGDLLDECDIGAAFAGIAE